MRSNRKPIMPMVSTATIIRPSELELPFWNSSHTNLPRPGFCASISAAINTIQPTPRESRRPVNISGNEEGSTSLVIFVNQPSCNTFPTFIKSLSMEETPRAVLMSVGHSEQRVTVIAKFKNDLLNQDESDVT